MNRILLILSILVSLQVSAQTSEKYNSDYENFYRAEELFEKEQYAAARREFRNFINEFDHPNDPMYIKASYYEAISALELYNNDAVTLLQAFNKNYPESIYKKNIYYRLGKFYYYKKKWNDALAWFSKLSIQDVPFEDRDEFYFKVGYANFKEENFDAARNAFVEVKDGSSQYAAPALYYYSHIAYQNEQYQVALEGFLKLADDEKFGKLVPYYIAQIYYLQGKYEEVTTYASQLTGKDGKLDEKEISLLIGDAFYRIGKYKEAVPYLEKYDRSSSTTRDEDYRLGYAYYKSNKFEKAVRKFDRVKKEEDSLGQVAFYHIGECMIQLKNILSARSAFEGAAFMDFDPVVQEDALYNYAILSYKLDINPYDEAVEAFEMYLNRYPNSERKEDVYQYLVNVYMSTNNYEKALSSLDKLPNKNIRLKQAYQLIAFNQGVSRYQKSDFNGAIKSFELVKKYPIDPSISGMAVYWTGDSYYRARNYDVALEHYKKFGLLPLTTAPGLKPEALYNIGYCYLEKADIYHAQAKKQAKGSAKRKSLEAKRNQMLTRSNEAFRNFVGSNPPGEAKKADAYMRIADSYFVIRENELAIKFYKKVLEQKSGHEDQALFYLAKTYGYMEGKSNDKISSLLEIINEYPQSNYLLRSLDAVAGTYYAKGQLDKALQYYNKIIYDHPQSALSLDASITVADIHFKQGNYDQAEQEYLDIMQAHSNENEICTRVATGLKELYLATNQPQKAEALANQYACVQFSADEKENLYYIPAIEAYHDSILSNDQRYLQAIPKLEAYLNKFPNGRYKAEIQHYLGTSHYELGDISTAVAVFREALSGSNSSYTVRQAAVVSKYLYNDGQFEEAIPYYKRLEQLSSDPEIIYNSKLGLMRSHFLVENWQNAALYAGKVLASTQLSSDVELKAHYVRGTANYKLAHYNDAKPSLKWLIANTTTADGAEARYCIADIAFQEGDMLDAHAEIDGLLKMKPKHNFWVAKGLILRARVYMNEDNLFQAESDLNSIITHYPNQTDGIVDEANALWDELMQLKDAPKRVEEEGERTIEIDEN